MDNGKIYYRRFLEGDNEGLAEMVREYRSGLILYINCIVHNMEVSQELCEETFVKIYVKKPKYNEKYSFKAWLYAVGRNVVRAYLRKRGREQEMDCDLQANDDIETEYIQSEDKLAVHRAMKKLNSDYCQILTLVYFENMSNKEAAKVMRKTNRQIENLLYYAKKALRAELERGGFEYGGL